MGRRPGGHYIERAHFTDILLSTIGDGQIFIGVLIAPFTRTFYTCTKQPPPLPGGGGGWLDWLGYSQNVNPWQETVGN